MSIVKVIAKENPHSIMPNISYLPTEELKEKFMQEVVKRYLKIAPSKVSGECEVTYTCVKLMANL